MGRKPLIKDTEWQDIVDRCIADNWTSAAISLYLKSRFGHEVDESSVRRYRLKEKTRIKKEYADVYVEARSRAFVEAHIVDGHIVDHLGELGNLIRLQRNRVEVDLQREAEMNMLISGTRHELELLGKMIHEYHEMLQDFGVVPRVGEATAGGPGLPVAPAAPTFPLIEMLDDEEKENVISLSRAIAKRQKQLEASAQEQ